MMQWSCINHNHTRLYEMQYLNVFFAQNVLIILSLIAFTSDDKGKTFSLPCNLITVHLKIT